MQNCFANKKKCVSIKSNLGKGEKNMFNFLAGPFAKTIEESFKQVNGKDTATSWLKPVAQLFDNMIIPITIILVIVGAIWLIWLGVKLARAEDEKAQQSAKKAIINVAVALVSVLVMIWVLTWFASSINTLFNLNVLSSS